MNRLVLIACLALPLAACQTFSIEEYAAAANTLDPDCGKRVHLELTPVIMGFWIVPVVSGTYDKACHPELLKTP